MRLRPAVSPSFPHTGTNTALAKIYAVEIQAASVTVMLKSPMIFGSARFTTVWSRRPRKVPKMTVARTIQRTLKGLSIGSLYHLYHTVIVRFIACSIDEVGLRPPLH